jgi:hypothetical protein
MGSAVKIALTLLNRQRGGKNGGKTMGTKINVGRVTRFIACAALVAAACQVASAQSACVSQGQTLSFTYGSSAGSAGSATASFTLLGSVLLVDYRNTSTGTTFLSGIGFNTSPELRRNVFFADATGGWDAGIGPGGGLGNYHLIIHGNGGKRLSPGGRGVAVFIMQLAPQTLCIDKTIAHLTGQIEEKPVGVPSSGGPPDQDGPPQQDGPSTMFRRSNKQSSKQSSK